MKSFATWLLGAIALHITSIKWFQNVFGAVSDTTSCRYLGKNYSLYQKIDTPDRPCVYCVCLEKWITPSDPRCGKIECPWKEYVRKPHCDKVYVKGKCCPTLLCPPDEDDEEANHTEGRADRDLEARDKCFLPKDPGINCRPLSRRYFYNITEQKCDMFAYGGCEGNENKFETLEECQHDCAHMSEPTTTVSAAGKKKNKRKENQRSKKGGKRKTPPKPCFENPKQRAKRKNNKEKIARRKARIQGGFK